MKMGSDIASTLLLAGTLIIGSALPVGTAQASDRIVVAPTTTDTARLSWKPPTTHVDGSGGLRLVNFKSYIRSPNEGWKIVDTVDAKHTTCTVRNLAVGMH